MLVTAVRLDKLYWIQDKTPPKQNFILVESYNAFLSKMYEKLNFIENPVSKYKTTLINLIEYLFNFLLEELFVCLYKLVIPHPSSFLEDTVGSGLKAKHLFNEINRIWVLVVQKHNEIILNHWA